VLLPPTLYQAFAPLREHERFWDLIENIDLVLAHFSAGLQQNGDPPSGAGAGAGADGGILPGGGGGGSGAGGSSSGAPPPPPPAYSVDKVLAHIRVAAQNWSAASLHQLADLKFTYEQEAAPDEFFTPYLWSLLLEHSGLGWQTAGVVLFTPAGLPAGPDGRLSMDGGTTDDTHGLAAVVVDAVEPSAA